MTYSSVNQWLAENRTILSNAMSLVMTTGLNSVLGFAFWWVAARSFLPESVGLASAAIAATTLLGTISTMGFGMLLISELPKRGARAGSLLITSLFCSGCAGLGLGVVLLVGACWFSGEMSRLASSILYAALFATGISLTAVSLVFDQAMIGLFLGRTQLLRNALFAISKLFLLVSASLAVREKGDMIIYICWISSIAFSLGAALYFERQLAGRLLDHSRIEWESIGPLQRSALLHHALNCSVELPSRLMPVIVAVVLSAALNASYYVAWMIAGLTYVATDSLTLVLFATGGNNISVLPRRLKMTLWASGSVVLLANLVMLFMADTVLQLFGDNYATEAGRCLQILCLGGFALIVKMHFVALQRIFQRVKRAILLFSGFAVMEIPSAVMGGVQGSLTGLAVGWVGALFIEAVLLILLYCFSDMKLVGATGSTMVLGTEGIAQVLHSERKLVSVEVGLWNPS